MASQTDSHVSFVLYRYTPSIPAAAIFTAVFIILAIVHTYMAFRYRSKYFIPFIIGLLFEAAGYIARIFSHNDPLALGPYIVQTMLILVAPPLFAASIYMTLGRLILYLDAESASLLRVKYIAKIFVVGDIISFLLQCGGGGYMSAGSLSAMEDGAHIVIGGLAVQLLFFGFFIIASAIFHYRVKKNPQYYTTRQVASSSRRDSWECMLWCIYGACVLILIRSIYRVVEFVEGNDGFVMHLEYLLYIFDAVLMALQAMLLLVGYPGRVLGGGKRRDGGVPLEDRADSEERFLRGGKVAV
ncbi:RTA1 domain protein [Aspergillus niger]|uniref:RTA1 domain protein n=1 Tax=Aspergillus niger TaxID=5061 RepID=A0A117DZS5_ASPNG|nr:RTA1 domain protein [Aspergillus niger]